ncbi:MAG: Aspartate--tRNA(Asp/Asn) ligase [candidate division WS2 bacterium]|uniref:Aspartate--tRNA(Asp/Asn) ligase n=1 Tax=Psychracetigena formicireducens TaxID=2986056 RepID=A0A9E2BG85_PSYF1|nr:Aspartate--tRNA(Asp/Asn) ligase [Candidatus Psychracetigena formicireducens]MBT9144337.1 Aspartate--tRNA(Asp/Asn) ligase [Candidatus Psychracetigena formicireducens]
MKRTVYAGNVHSIHVGEYITIKGWVQKIRNHGGVLFIDVRDREGVVQTVWHDFLSTVHAELLLNIKPEEVVEISGYVRRRPEESINYQIKTGEVEILGSDIIRISSTLPLPFEISREFQLDELLRMKYRYLDLRRESLNKNIIFRSKISKLVRDFFHGNGFIEVETPLIVKYTPGGARNFLIPSRVFTGKFFALAESPQIYKQLLMIANFDKYFQLSKCFRDEDPRSDRQIEFTQIDVEMSFIDQFEVMSLVENLLGLLWKEILDIDLPKPFKIITYDESICRYGTDKPDLRYSLEVLDFTTIFQHSNIQYLKEAPFVGGIICRNASKTGRKYLQSYDEYLKSYGGKGVKVLKLDEQEKDPELFTALKTKYGMQPGDVLMVIGGEKYRSLELLGLLRKKIIEVEKILPDKEFELVWVVDFPLFELSKEGNINSKHHPFTSPLVEDIPLFSTNPLKMRAQAYDIVINGVELGGGSLRIISPDIQQELFKTLGLSDKEIEEKFGFLLKALSFGAPPHGGIALGFDRLVAILMGEESIREVIAFPKMTSTYDPLTDAPSEVEHQQLKNLHIKVED